MSGMERKDTRQTTSCLSLFSPLLFHPTSTKGLSHVLIKRGNTLRERERDPLSKRSESWVKGGRPWAKGRRGVKH